METNYYQMTVFWDAVLVSVVEINIGSRSACCLHHTFETSVTCYHTAQRNIPDGYHHHIIALRI
jgi:hypothetical protein